MIAISAVYQALMQQLLSFFQSPVRSMVQTTPPSWLVKNSSVCEEDAQIFGIVLSGVWNSYTHRGKHWIAFNYSAMDIHRNESPTNGVNWYMKIRHIFVEGVGIEKSHGTLGSLLRPYKRLRISSKKDFEKAQSELEKATNRNCSCLKRSTGLLQQKPKMSKNASGVFIYLKMCIFHHLGNESVAYYESKRIKPEKILADHEKTRFNEKNLIIPY